MTFQIEDVNDHERGCGWRKPGFYLRKDDVKIIPCGKLPLRLGTCEHCGLRIKLTRGLQKINVGNLFRNVPCQKVQSDDPAYWSTLDHCAGCLINRTGFGYLIGVGFKHYKSGDDFRREALELGISKRIAFPLPRDFVVGKSVVLIGHPKVYADYVPEEYEEEDAPEIEEDAPQKPLPIIMGHAAPTGRRKVVDTPGVIMMFVPERIEYVVGGNESDELLESYASQGLTLVRVHRVQDQQLALETA